MAEHALNRPTLMSDSVIRERAPIDVLRATRWHFLGLCLYLAAQAYTIPILPIGPSWAIWPGLADFVIILMGFAVIIRPLPSNIAVSTTNRQMMKALIFVYGVCFLSFMFFRFVRAINGESLRADPGLTFGIFQLYRLAQFFFLFWVAMRIPFNKARLRILQRVTVFVLIVMGIGVILTHYQIVSPSTFVSHLPDNEAISGPWNIYYSYTRLGLPAPFGMVSYNHAYTGIQVILLLSFYLHLRRAHSTLFDVLLLAFCNFTVFLSESRAGMAALLMFTVLFFFYRRRYILILAAASIAAVLAMLVGIIPNPFASIISTETLARGATLLDVTNPQNLSSRDLIWMQRLNFLNEDLTRWLFGTGFGNTVNSGSNAHMLPLHLIMEGGIWGLTIFSVLALWVMRRLWLYDTYARPIFWGSLALLLSSLTQETFYPVPALAYFLGVYCVVLSIAWRAPFEEQPVDTVTSSQSASLL